MEHFKTSSPIKYNIELNIITIEGEKKKLIKLENMVVKYIIKFSYTYVEEK